MNGDPYNPVVRDYFARPEHAGEVMGEDAAVAFFEDQGMRIRLSAKVAREDIKTLRFLAWGCPHVIAAAEAFCRRFEGRPAAELANFDASQLMRDLAVPVEKTGRILVLEDTVRSLRAAIQDRNTSQAQD
ncbi:MAG: iron-sulfur cluster assembly scaffold protein [Gammaproteobacteria bacterium]|nr:iron-sulfur cluster assembly scaffold protein [Gammaproteobacteria bacterium]MDH5242136.1 iron-sulfur cluster assembly scaffold protein [Gammaproteobacteria bacterium]MDH5261094.1 iron-sulfur cluster assembly scaffold protein [Gammaproteobacteria bacterium]